MLDDYAGTWRDGLFWVLLLGAIGSGQILLLVFPLLWGVWMTYDNR